VADGGPHYPAVPCHLKLAEASLAAQHLPQAVLGQSAPVDQDTNVVCFTHAGEATQAQRLSRFARAIYFFAE
jgi:hypothetical protein